MCSALNFRGLLFEIRWLNCLKTSIAIIDGLVKTVSYGAGNVRASA
jgi:hypothetical protein